MCGDVTGEGIIATVVGGDLFAVEVDGGTLIYCAKVQDYTAFVPIIGQGKMLLIVRNYVQKIRKFGKRICFGR